MQIEISKQEAWKLLDAIESYTKDYTVAGSVEKIFTSLNKKLKEIINET